MQKNDIDKFERLCYNDYIRYKRNIPCSIFTKGQSKICAKTEQVSNRKIIYFENETF